MLSWLIKFIFCRHYDADDFVRNIYGDEIIHRGGKRSLWRCRACGDTVASDKLALYAERGAGPNCAECGYLVCAHPQTTPPTMKGLIDIASQLTIAMMLARR